MNRFAVLRIVSFILTLFCAGEIRAQTIHGAGASFPYPLYSEWAVRYQQESGVRINYQPIGSGGGLAQVKVKTVDFGATDIPLENSELDEAGLLQFPMVLGGVTPVVNIRGIKAGELRLTPELIVRIFLGEIKNWNDPAIRRINPDLKLPSRMITVVHRINGSGTTWIFTNYLTKVSAKWSKRVGSAKAVEWPVGIGGRGNEGVASNVQRTNGAIGYVEFAYALQNRMTWTMMKNRSGKYVAPTMESFQTAVANADWSHSPGFYLVLTNQPGAKSWPITGASFLLIRREQKDAVRAKRMLDYFDWCFTSGGGIAEKLHYVPVPDTIVKFIEKSWRECLVSDGKPVW